MGSSDEGWVIVIATVFVAALYYAIGWAVYRIGMGVGLTSQTAFIVAVAFLAVSSISVSARNGK
jgi:hypothetical protein